MTQHQALREQYRKQKTDLLQVIANSGASTRGIRSTLTKLSRLVDDTLRQLWRQAGFTSQFALVAVGGFGRGEMFPHSDVDVLLLLPDNESPETDEQLKSRIETFIGSCWDTGLEIGSSVRNVSECLTEAEKDVTVQTSLLESRLITGDAALFARFSTAFLAAINPKAFLLAKKLELRQRHNKFDNTPYSLEPNCKESPGGLRDLQVILWVARAAGFAKNWDDLARNGLATPFEIRQIKQNEALLKLIRARLHLIANRREDRLVFDLQTAVAESFGFRSETLDGTKLPVRASEALMRRYYWAAKAVSQLHQILMLNIEERLNPSTHEPRPINARFSDKAGMIEVNSDDLYQREPHAILETFLVFESTPGVEGLSARTLRALYNARGIMNGKFRNDPVNHETFKRILSEPEGITHAFRLLNETSVLGRYLWVFRKIVGQMQHDLFHVYTVDQHILMVLRNVRRFFLPEHAHEYPFCSQLAAGWDKPWILYLAALFHDIAKGRGGDHSDLGAVEVRRFCRQHKIEPEDCRIIEFLVQEHLTMSRIAQKSDLSDPDVIAAFAKRVGNERRLTALYLLTVADIRGTSPNVWNAWKGKLLEDLFYATLRTLGGRAPDPAAEVETRKRLAMVELALHAEPPEFYRQLWEQFDVGYFMRHTANDIAWHTKQLARHVNTDKAIVRARRSIVGEGLQVLVYAKDQPDIFARICAYFDQSDFSILDARIYTTRHGYALDTFQVVTSMLPEHYQELTSMVEVELHRAISETGPLPPPSRGRVSRRVKSFPVSPRITLRPDEKAQRWLLNIMASDRVGLLYSIARILAQHKVNVQLAKIATLGERVDDTFLIAGPELQHNRAQIDIETELLKALED
ncbi:MAG: [protein-PII] uridylyltransferase [Gammaproteobacteria bacterium]|nr:[protein-PII] uridylyltransferase [Gammaproteobacteria bacterium]MBU0788734.1 [protein-PII] uridylyltransferase [Gammaproteobacteria bacterium]MBU0814646.1 [protein-PII] uridylyltransferase [Gammaproteobacteria bacterium]MBU1786511.1 [protein-PII] uridylyltransferase [Gammaproteobacteria bacterium]